MLYETKSEFIYFSFPIIYIFVSFEVDTEKIFTIFG